MSRSRSHWLRAIAPIVVLCSTAAACDGASHGSQGPAQSAAGGSSDASPGAGSSGAPGTATNGWPEFGPTKSFQLRRLTSEQYLASVKTLLGVSTDGMPPIEPITPVAGFTAIGASSVSVSGMGVAQFENAARFLADAAFGAAGPREKLAGCSPTGPSDSACLQSFVSSFGPRIFRRPLSADEAKAYTALGVQVATATSDVWQGFAATLSAFLQSPNFLYLTEVGAPASDQPARYHYTDYEMASRLAYFLTNETPDDDLLAAAKSGALVDAAGVRAQATRLLSTPAAHEAVRSFFGALLALDNLDKLTRPVELFPKFTATLGAAMRQETFLTLDDLVFTSDGDYRHLFDQRETFLNAELAALYGLPAPAGGGFVRTTLPASLGRVGLLGQAGVLAARDHADGTSPTKRGLFVLTRLLCQDLPLAPPANLAIPPPPSGLLTARERLEQHAKSTVCASCHSHTDPVGLSLEHFDAMGVYRETDHDLAIDDTGELDGKSYQGEPGLGAMLRDHPALEPCLVRSLYGVAVGHPATDFDQATFKAMVDELAENGARIRALLAAIATSDGFRYLPTPSGN